MLGYAIGVMLSCFDEWQRRRTAERQKYREALAAGGAAVASISGELSRAIMGSAARIMLWVSLGATFFGLVEGRDWVDAVTLTTNPHPSPGPNPGPNPDPNPDPNPEVKAQAQTQTQTQAQAQAQARSPSPTRCAEPSTASAGPRACTWSLGWRC